MSILIKGMEMPNYCYECPFHSKIYNGIKSQWWCSLLNKIAHDDEGHKTKECPLVEVQDTQTEKKSPNGDPIDRQDAIDVIRFECGEWTGLAKTIENKINELPPAQPDRSLWFRIGETCVYESKGFISAERAVEKIRELLREGWRTGMRMIDADPLKRRAQKVATEAWKMKLDAKIETTLNQFIEWIDQAKTIEPEQRWIPVTERLPEKNVWVLVTFMMANGEVDTDIMRINRWDGGWDTHTFDMAYRETVIAWMPLPEPYGGEQE